MELLEGFDCYARDLSFPGGCYKRIPIGAREPSPDFDGSAMRDVLQADVHRKIAV